jgi:L-iditol 2-dehydrogenase
MGETMQALMMKAIKELQIVEVPIPEIEHPDDVVVKVKSVGICGSDLHGYTGESGRRIPPLIMGHEATGDVIRVGEGVQSLRPGDRVAIQTVHFCGKCSQCLAGQQNLCENRRIMGMNESGAYAEYVRWRSESLFKLPEGLPYEHGALAEPLSVAVHAVGLASFKPYDTVFVVGAGTIGLLALSVLKLMGVSCIIVSDTSDTRLEVARKVGAHVTVNPQTEDVRQVVEQYTDGKGVDVSFEAVGLGATAQQTLEVTRNKGTVIWIGNNHRMVEIDMQAIVTRELNVIGSYGMSSQEFERSLKMLADGQIPVEHLINRRATLSEGPGLFDELLASPETIKCVINM